MLSLAALDKFVWIVVNWLQHFISAAGQNQSRVIDLLDMYHGSAFRIENLHLVFSQLCQQTDPTFVLIVLQIYLCA